MSKFATMAKDISFHITDIFINSVKAGATEVRVEVCSSADSFEFRISDNGCGMKPDILAGVMDPFYTTRTTRKVGLGVPLLKMAAEQTGGEMRIESYHESDYPDRHGTVVTAVFYKNHIDFTPLGDVISTVTTLIQGSPEIDFVFSHTSDTLDVSLNTEEMREILGNEVPLNTPEVLQWIAESLREQYGNLL